MTYVVNDKCIKCKLMDCVEVCPVDCFYEGKNMLVIKPEECIDCGVCEPECPVDAIVADTESGSEKWLELNTKYSEIWPNITIKKDPPRIMKNIKMKKTSTTNILAKIFKKTPEKKVKKKTKAKVAKKPTPTKAKVIKKNISVKKTKTIKATPTKIKKNLKTVSKKAVPEKVEIKTDNLRISKSNEVKPEIKKVKKQETEKREYKVKDYVVYPKHGVGQITEFKKINIGGIDVETYVLKFEKDKANGMVPVNKQSHLRPLATINQVNKCISILKSKPKIKRSMWSRRAQEYEAKISSGKIYELAEVVRDLNKGDDLMVDQSYSERQLFEKAYERILSEFQIVMGVSLEDTQKKLDKALKRNLEGQAKAVAAPTKIKEPITESDTDSEPITDTED